jgi:CBS-domain-containing membrane protein
MNESSISDDPLTIGDLLDRTEKRAAALIHGDTTAREMITAMARSSQCRALYVVDAENRLIGAISLAALVRHAVSEAHVPQVHGRKLIEMISDETAEHIMNPAPFCVTEQEELPSVVKRLIDADLEEFPVVDVQMRVIGHLTLVDLLDARIP